VDLKESPTPMRQAVDLPKAYRLLNHGPTVLVSAAHAGQRNVMAAAWAMPLDFDPPKVVVVIDKSTYTRGLVEASGHFVLNVPCRDFADASFTVGSVSGRDMGDSDKFARYGLASFAGSVVGAPLLEGCVAWLECRRRTTSSVTTSTSARCSPRRQTTGCSRTGAGTSAPSTTACAPSTMWRAVRS
jgi:flavin reductase (DIM6/NTAB) family NADH-FMN oxidoreductase RutF